MQLLEEEQEEEEEEEEEEEGRRWPIADVRSAMRAFVRSGQSRLCYGGKGGEGRGGVD